VRFSGSPAGIAGVADRIIVDAEILLAAGRTGREVWLELAVGSRVPARAMFMPAPHSYTGEEMLELVIPGSAAMLSVLTGHLLELRDADGEALLRLARPGEFSARAMEHGRLTPEQLEGISLMIAASTQEEHRAGLALLQGAIGRAIDATREELVELVALIEAGIDFADQEDVTPISRVALAQRLARLQEKLAVIAQQGQPLAGDASRASAVPRVFVIGPPNAGKSTLLNAMVEQFGSSTGGVLRSVTSEIAGTTRDLLAARIHVQTQQGPLEIELIDAPGLEDAADAQSLVHLIQERTRAQLGSADLLLVCSPVAAFAAIARGIAGVVDASTPRLFVRTKSDRPMPAWSDHGFEEIKADVQVCALTGQRVCELASLLAGRLGTPRASMWPERLVQGFASAREQMMCAQEILRSSMSVGRTDGLPSMEVLAHHLRMAHDELSQLTGPLQGDAILGRIFASFCIGK
jgi:tRNA modification GTPase